jgi:hypothetical protein
MNALMQCIYAPDSNQCKAFASSTNLFWVQYGAPGIRCPILIIRLYFLSLFVVCSAIANTPPLCSVLTEVTNIIFVVSLQVDDMTLA